MTATERPTGAGDISAPVVSQVETDKPVEAPEVVVPGGLADIKARRGKKRRTTALKLSDGKTYTLISLRPAEISAINKATLEEVPVDPNDPDNEETKLQYNDMRPYYLVAKALLDTDGSRAWASKMGEDDAYMAGGQMLADLLDYNEIQDLVEAVYEVSGMNRKAQEKAKKVSAPTPGAGK